MNKQIIELAKQAGIIGQSESSISPPVQQFVELIVRECSKVIVNGGYRNPALGEKHPLTPPEIATMIEEHFGVEE
jgi:hypothetical protein